LHLFFSFGHTTQQLPKSQHRSFFPDIKLKPQKENDRMKKLFLGLPPLLFSLCLSSACANPFAARSTDISAPPAATEPTSAKFSLQNIAQFDGFWARFDKNGDFADGYYFEVPPPLTAEELENGVTQQNANRYFDAKTAPVVISAPKLEADTLTYTLYLSEYNEVPRADRVTADSADQFTRTVADGSALTYIKIDFLQADDASPGRYILRETPFGDAKKYVFGKFDGLVGNIQNQNQTPLDE
jgi:hypothetical protein